MGRQALCVEQLRAARLFGAAAQRVQQRVVAAHFGRRVLELPVHEAVQDEDLAGERTVEAAEVASAGRHYHEPVEGHLLRGPHEAASRVPFRRMAAVAAEWACGPFNPLRLYGGGVAGEEAGRIDQLAGHYPRRGRLLERRGWMDREAQPMRAAIFALLLVELPYAAEQAGQERLVQKGGGLLGLPLPSRRERKAELLREIRQLAREVAPFAHLGVREVRLLRERSQLGLRQRGALAVPPPPQPERAEEVRAGRAELRMGLHGLLALLHRTAARVVAGHCGDDRHCVAESRVL